MNYHNLKNLAVACLWVTSLGAIARDPVIYGVDNRIETFQSKNPLYQRLAQSTAARIPLSAIGLSGSNAELRGPSIADARNICPEVRFAHQSYVADCSGVLVKPDVIATAGHCSYTEESCRDYAWVFNYKVRNSRQKNVNVRSRDVYRCKEVITYSMTGGRDFALIRLDRPVENAQPVKVALLIPHVGTPLVTIGNPTGMPQKIADGAIVKSSTSKEFKANLDTFEKGSGSPVFLAKTGEMVGILVRGATDYIDHPTRSCLITNEIADNSPGEDVSSTVQFFHLLKNL